MRISPVEADSPVAQNVTVSDDVLTVGLSDGRILVVPLTWFPRLLHGSTVERSNWRLIGKGSGIHWPDLDEDVSIEGLLLGRPSGESESSFQRWLQSRDLPSSDRPRRGQ
jgi:hypothetical protein